MQPPLVRPRARAALLVFFLLALLPACASPAPADAPAPLRIATWNVHRLFDASCDSARCAAGDYEGLPSPAELELSLDRMARALEALDADVLLLQEIESGELLDALALRMGERYPHRVFAERGRPASLDVGILSALPVLEVREHGGVPLHRPDGSPTSFTRDPLELRLSSLGGELIVFDVHLKSKHNDDPGRRLAEARGLAALVEEAARRHPGARVLLGGDLNDVPGSAPLEALHDGAGLRRVGGLLPRGEGATHAFEGRSEAIDHILVPQRTFLSLTDADVEIFGSPSKGYAGSDHAALLLRLPAIAER